MARPPRHRGFGSGAAGIRPARQEAACDAGQTEHSDVSNRSAIAGRHRLLRGKRVPHPQHRPPGVAGDALCAAITPRARCAHRRAPDELYELRCDPGEARNRVGDLGYAADFHRLRERLYEHLVEHGHPCARMFRSVALRDDG